MHPWFEQIKDMQAAEGKPIVVVHLKATHNILRRDMEVIEARTPGGAPTFVQARLQAYAQADGGIRCGIWEALPGTWRREITASEFCHFVTGRATYTPDEGAVVEFAAGDAAFFPPNSCGTWVVYETLRKTYFVLEC